MGVDGNPVRCPNWEEEGLGYYKIYFAKDSLMNKKVGLLVNFNTDDILTSIERIIN